MFDISHLVISRVSVHHIPSHGPNKTVAVPTSGQSLVVLTNAAKDMVVQRLTKVLGKNSNGIQVGITNGTPQSFFSDRGWNDFRNRCRLSYRIIKYRDIVSYSSE